MKVDLICASTGEPAVAFATLAAVIAVGTGATAMLWPLMKGVVDAASEAKVAMPDKLADPPFVKRQRRKLGRELIGWALIVNLVNLCALTALWVILFRGPNEVLSRVASGTVLQTFTPLERLLYSLTACAWTLTYLYQGLAPWMKGLRQYVKAGSWLRDRSKGK